MQAVLLLPGAVVTYRLFKTFAARKLRSVTKAEYKKATENLTLDNAGFIETFTTGNHVKSIVFVKTSNLPDKYNSDIDLVVYQDRKKMKSPKSITDGLRRLLIENGLIAE